MDIINVISVSGPAKVTQIIKSDGGQKKDFYWRQAFDVKTNEIFVRQRTDKHRVWFIDIPIILSINIRNLRLQTTESICKCGQPTNPNQITMEYCEEDCVKRLH